MQRVCYLNCTLFITKLTLSDNADLIIHIHYYGITFDYRFESFKSQKSIKFSCKFARKVEAGKRFIAGDLPGEEDEVVSIGYLSYSMNVSSGTLGSITQIQIIADHNMENIYPR